MKTNMRTAVIYARYSSDIQKDRSIDDQIALCRQIAERNRCKVVDVYSDRAKSGATMFERDGLLALMAAAKKRSFQVVISESLSRLSRCPVDTPSIHRRLTFDEVTIIDTNGEVSDVHIAVGSIVNSQFLKNLAQNVKRGRIGRVREGLVPGRVAYGYRRVPGKPGERLIHPEHAKIVRRIFCEYAAGKSPRQIALDLSKGGITSPRGDKFWNHQRLLGSSSALLRNPIYIGQLVWNKRRNIKSPEGKKSQRPSAAEDVITIDVPHLRIIDQDLWERVQAVRDERSLAKFGPSGKTYTKKAEHFMVGLLRCGACSGRMVIGALDRDLSRRITCAAGYRSVGCDHRKSYDLKKLETLILEGIKTKLTDRKALIEMTRAYHGRWAERQKQARGDREVAQKALNRAQIKIDRIVAAIASEDGGEVGELMAALKALRVEKAGLTERLKVIDAESNIVDLHPRALDKFAATMDELSEALGGTLNESQLAPFRMAFSSIFDRIVVHPTGKRKPYEVTPYARLGAIMGFDLFPKIASVEEMLAEQGVAVPAKTAPSSSQWWQNHNMDGGLINLGRWKQAA